MNQHILKPQQRTAGRTATRRLPRRRGSVLAYSVALVVVSTAFISLAVDYGKMQMIKTQEQRCCDAIARGILAGCQARASGLGMTPTVAANLYGAYFGAIIYSANPISYSTGYSAPIPVVGSYYNNTFYADAGVHGPLAIQVIISRNVPLAFPLPNGRGLVRSSNTVWAKATAVLPNPVVLSETVQATQDPWLAGMTSGTASYNDTAPANSPTALTVIPGSTITWSSVTGLVNHLGGAGTPDGPTGQAGNLYWHMKDPPSGAQPLGGGAQNGIGDTYAPIDSLLGVFLPSGGASSTAPSNYRNYSTDMALANGVNNLQVQQPFYIGNGQNSSTKTQSFTVPNTATSLYLGIMDGYEWNNNVGSMNVYGSEQPPIQIVQ